MDNNFSNILNTFRRLDEAARAIPGSPAWNSTVQKAKASGETSPNLLYNMFQNVPKKYFQEFVNAVCSTVDEAKQPSENRAHWDKVMRKGVVPSIDRERYTDLSHEGLEGPFRAKSGEILYYDPKAGRYYNRDSDMYVDYGLNEAIPPTQGPGIDDSQSPIQGREESRMSPLERKLRERYNTFKKQVEEDGTIAPAGATGTIPPAGTTKPADPAQIALDANKIKQGLQGKMQLPPGSDPSKLSTALATAADTNTAKTPLAQPQAAAITSTVAPLLAKAAQDPTLMGQLAPILKKAGGQ
jgi:hypothetical protein